MNRHKILSTPNPLNTEIIRIMKRETAIYKEALFLGYKDSFRRYKEFIGRIGSLYGNISEALAMKTLPEDVNNELIALSNIVINDFNGDYNQNLLYFSHHHEHLIKNDEAWAQVVHIKIALLYLNLQVKTGFVSQNHSINQNSLALIDDLFHETIPFAPCLNNAIYTPLLLLFRENPVLVSKMILNKLDMLKFRQENDKCLNKIYLDKDREHNIQKIILIFYPVLSKTLEQSGVSEEDNNLLNSVYIYEKDEESIYFSEDDYSVRAWINVLDEVLRRIFYIYAK